MPLRQWYVPISRVHLRACRFQIGANIVRCRIPSPQRHSRSDRKGSRNDATCLVALMRMPISVGFPPRPLTPRTGIMSSRVQVLSSHWVLSPCLGPENFKPRRLHQPWRPNTFPSLRRIEFFLPLRIALDEVSTALHFKTDQHSKNVRSTIPRKIKPVTLAISDPADQSIAVKYN